MSEEAETPTGQHVPAASTLGAGSSDATEPSAPADAVSSAPADAVSSAPADAEPAAPVADADPPPPAADAPPPPPASDPSPPPSGSDSSAGGPAAVVQNRPEVAVGAAFAGGFVLALILKRLAS